MENKCTTNHCTTHGSHNNHHAHNSGCPSSKMPNSPEEALHFLMAEAMEAKKELIRDKIKAAFEKKEGEKMDKMAEFAADTMHAMWSKKIEAHKGMEDMMKSFKGIMSD